MVILENQTDPKVKTDKQTAKVADLLQCSYFSKAEFIDYSGRCRNQIVTCYDASILIAHLISTLRFRKKFYGKRYKAHLKCDYCSSKKNLDRLYSSQYNAQRVVCLSCEDKKAEAEQEQNELAESNLQRLKDQGISVHEGPILEPVEELAVGLTDNGKLDVIKTGRNEPGMFRVKSK